MRSSVVAEKKTQNRIGVRASFVRALVRLRTPAGFLFVSVTALLLFTLWPIARAVWMSLHDWSFLRDDQVFVGLDNYRELLGDERWWNALKNTLIYTIATVSLNVGLALMLAVILNGAIRGRAFLRAAFFLPVVTSFGIMAIVFGFLLSPDIGLIVKWMTAIGFPEVAWLREPGTAMAAVIMVGVWKVTGFNMVILLAGLQGIPEEHYEAALVDGAGPVARFWHISVPGLRQQIIFVTVISVIASLQAFDQIFVMTRGGPLLGTETIVPYLFTQGFERFRVGYAATLSVALFFIILVVSIAQLKIFRFSEVD